MPVRKLKTETADDSVALRKAKSDALGERLALLIRHGRPDQALTASDSLAHRYPEAEFFRGFSLALTATLDSQRKHTFPDVIPDGRGYKAYRETAPNQPTKTGETGETEIMPNSLQPY